MDNKTDLRIWAKSIRKSINIGEISRKISFNIKNSESYQESENIMLFYPKSYEVNLLSLLDDEKKQFYLPKVFEDKILVCPFKKGDELNVSEFNIKEPCTAAVSADILDLVIVPALIADKRGYRLGYGGGFYDRFLAEYNARTILPIPSRLLIDKLPNCEYDIPIDVIITEL